MDKLRKAVRITEQSFKVARKVIVIGITEKKIASKLRKCAICNGADGLAFHSIICSSDFKNIHPHPTNKKIKENEFVIVDFGVRYKGIRTDVTRTYCIKPDKNKIKLYQLLKNAQKIAEKKIKVGAPCSEADLAARKYLKKHTRLKFPYSIGHGVGKKTHQRPRISPKSKDVFKVGDVFTLEPGLHSEKIGLRIEDMYLLTGKGLIKLTKNISSDL
ncbi:MAG: M24 family metallopeptidase [Candidatus Aenigmarchaeota archaeon]|nr:M24 family metallopeptidase [Candidatus Aenigmarchaeota archaeon]